LVLLHHKPTVSPQTDCDHGFSRAIRSAGIPLKTTG
jgi:hypothetical protein